MENMAPFFLRGVLRHQGEALPTLGMADYEQQAESSEFEQEDLRSSGARSPYALSCRHDRSPGRTDLTEQPVIPALSGTFAGGLHRPDSIQGA